MESNHSVGQEGLMSIKVVKNPWTATTYGWTILSSGQTLHLNNRSVYIKQLFNKPVLGIRYCEHIGSSQ